MNIDIDEIIAKLPNLDEDAVGKYVNKIADLYREGEDLRGLIPLLEHPDSRFVSTAAWIVSEVVDKARGREVFAQLSRLLGHPDPSVRFAVISSVALLLEPEDRSAVRRLLLLAADPNPGVRQQALHYLCLIPDSTVLPLSTTDIWPSARLLLAGAGRNEIRSGLASKELLSRRLAIAGALRNYGADEAFLGELVQSLDSEVVHALPTLPRRRAPTPVI